MNFRHACTVTGAAVLSCAVAFAQSTQQAPAQPVGQAGIDDKTPITLIGCVQREADYRRANDSGRGGVAATGLGRGNESYESGRASSAPTSAGDRYRSPHCVVHQKSN